ncbi:hypothetical protein BH23CHL8_BH23CHL8_03240 [soil metagenome]
MVAIRITSVDAPLDRPGLGQAAARLVRRASGVGLLAGTRTPERLDLELVRDIARSALAEGVGQDAALAILRVKEAGSGVAAADELGDLLARLDDALASSPMPGRELGELLRTYDPDTLAAMLGVSIASLRRYARRTRRVPDDVAERIHYLALVSSDLAGSYNEFGMRRWWQRPRSLLGGRSPRGALIGAWDPDGPDARAVADMARGLTGGGAAT